MSTSLSLSWREGIAVSQNGDGRLVVADERSRVTLPHEAPEISDALERLAPPGEDEDRLSQFVSVGNPSRLARWYYYVDQLSRHGFLRCSLHAGAAKLATLVPLGDLPAAHQVRTSLPGSYLLSRFACFRRMGQDIVVESPTATARLVLHDPRAAALIGWLAVPSTAQELADRIGSPAMEVADQLLVLLLRAGLIDRVDGSAECNEHSLATWEFHDLLFHAHSRRGRSDAAFGGTYRFAGRQPPPHAVKRVPEGEPCELYRPNLERLMVDDPPLARVQELRRSIREYADSPISARELGEFLYRVGRLRNVWEVEVESNGGPLRVELADRPFPSGGALYEMEFYVAVNVCAGLAEGLYYYDPLQHRLVRLKERTAEVERLLADAAASSGTSAERLQVLLILAARFGRVAWKYESIAYALVLKNVGVVYQTMYLAATAMGLAPCALGCGDSDLFAFAAGCDYYAETSVGEFLLGSKP